MSSKNKRIIFSIILGLLINCTIYYNTVKIDNISYKNGAVDLIMSVMDIRHTAGFPLRSSIVKQESYMQPQVVEEKTVSTYVTKNSWWFVTWQFYVNLLIYSGVLYLSITKINNLRYRVKRVQK